MGLQPSNIPGLNCITLNATSSTPISRKIQMPNWVTFDQETSSTLRSRMPQGSIFQRPGSSMMEYLLEDREATVAVLPSSGDNHAVVAVFRWNKLPAPAEPPMTPIRSRAGGFLGLT